MFWGPIWKSVRESVFRDFLEKRREHSVLAKILFLFSSESCYYLLVKSKKRSFFLQFFWVEFSFEGFIFENFWAKFHFEFDGNGFLLFYVFIQVLSVES